MSFTVTRCGKEVILLMVVAGGAVMMTRVFVVGDVREGGGGEVLFGITSSSAIDDHLSGSNTMKRNVTENNSME